MSITHIHHNEIQQQHNELVSALGTENNPSQWIVFMDAAHRLLPFLFDSGRPTKSQIENSLIGKLGFSSWSQMIEADSESGGLSWSVNTWKQWSKAYKVIQANDFMREMDITASKTMAIAKEFKDKEFPTSIDDMKTAQLEMKLEKEKAELDKTANLKTRISELETALATGERELSLLRQQLELSQEQYRQFVTTLDKKSNEYKLLMRANVELTVRCSHLQEENDKLKTRTAKKKKPKGLLARLKSWFTGK